MHRQKNGAGQSNFSYSSISAFVCGWTSPIDLCLNFGISVYNLTALAWQDELRIARTSPIAKRYQQSYKHKVDKCKIMGMNTSDTHNQRIAKMTFASVYPLYLAKVEKKGRTKEELDQVIKWLTGFDNKKLQELIKEKVTFGTFFQHATLNSSAHLITGLICGYRIEDIENPLTQQVRYLDKLVDELAKGRKMEKILRSS